jgi:hypothetical protein
MKSIRVTANFLRVIALLQLLTAGLCFVPESTLGSLYSWAGLGQMPHLPFLRYVVRGAAYCQGAVGLLLWVIATDVIRFRPLVITTAAIYLVAAPAFYVIHATAGMPRWWAIMDTASCFVVGAVLLALCRLSSSDASPTRTVA